MATTVRERRLRLRPALITPVSEVGAVDWSEPTALLFEDNATASLDMDDGTFGEMLRVRFAASREVLWPYWEVTGIEARVRAACTGNTQPSFEPPVLGLKILPGEGNVYASPQREIPLSYRAEATDWVTIGGVDDLWSIPDVYHVAQDAATIGLILEIDPLAWDQREALLEIDSAEIVLHLRSVPLVQPDGEPVQSLGRNRMERYSGYGEEPETLLYGALAGNSAEGQVWLGGPDDVPVPLISFRGDFAQARSYKIGQVVVREGAIYRATANKAAGAAWNGANWAALG